MPSHKLTKSYIDSFKPLNREVEIYDTVEESLALRVMPSGYKSYIVRYRYGDISKRYTIASVKQMKLADARKEAAKLALQVKDGVDLVQLRRSKRIKPDKKPTFNEVADLFIKEYLPNKRPSTQRDYKSRINKHIKPHFRYVEIDSVKREDINSLLKKVATDNNQPVHSNRIRAILSKIFSFAISENLAQLNPVTGTKKYGKETSRDKSYNKSDVMALWQAFEDELEPYQTFLKTLLLTGQRCGETSRVKWADLNFDECVWTIPASETKAGRTHIVPFSSQLNKHFEYLKNTYSGEYEYVFASKMNDSKPISYFKNLAERIRKRSKISDFQIHDLRHIAATEMIKLKIPDTIVGKVLNHGQLSKENVITSRYIQYDYFDEKKEALQKWSEHLFDSVLKSEELE